MADDGEEVDALGGDVDRQLANRLRRVRVHEQRVFGAPAATDAARAAAAIAATGCTAPTSLFECITVTRIVSFVTAAATASAPTRPSPSHGTYVARSRPSASRTLRHSSMAGCSMLEVTTCGSFFDLAPARRRASSAASAP